jgi:hypothetical protein
VPGDEFYLYPMLPRWLANDAEPIRFRFIDVLRGRAETTVFRPERP